MDDMQEKKRTGLFIPSKVCKLIMLVLCFKLCIIGMFFFDALPFFSSSPANSDVGSNISAPVTPVASGASAIPAAQGIQTAPVEQTQRYSADLSKNPSKSVSDVVKPIAVAVPQKSGVAYAATTTPASPATPNATAGQTGALAGQPADTNINRDALNRRAEELNRREQDLNALEKEIDAKLEQMQALEARLQGMIKEADALKDDKIRQLVDVISNMKAKNAADVLSTLDERIAVKVLAGMRGRQAGEILTYATPEKAARLSEALARMQLPFE